MRYIQPPQIATYQLSEWDPSGETTVTIRAHRAGETRRRAQLWERQITEEDTGLGLIRRIREDTLADVVWLDCYLTLVTTNIAAYLTPGDEEPEELFWPGMDEETFMQRFNLLPDELAAEWHAKVLEHNPEWAI